MRLRPLLALLCVLSLGANAASAASRDVIICGSGGDETYKEKFAAWGRRLRKVLVEKLGRPRDSVVLLLESSDGAATPAETSDLKTIRAVLERAARELEPGDDLFLYLIGHGSALRNVPRFHIPGPDLTADELAALLEPVRARRLVVINAASAGAGFINALSKPGRIVCTATKSVEEKNATEFIEYFIQALEDGSADQNRDERISVLEACRQGAALTAAYYTGRGLIATEHALLDDEGAGKGIRLVADSASDAPSETNAAGAAEPPRDTLAAQVFLKDFSFPPSVPRDLVDRYLSLLNRVEELKRKKAEMENKAYSAALETLLVEAARAHRDIRRAASR